MYYHLIGVKGGGMTSLVTIIANRGDEVSGFDAEKYIFTQQPPEERHTLITLFSVGNVHEGDTVIIRSAFNKSGPEVKKTLVMDTMKTYWYRKFPDGLAKKCASISIAGAHGKTMTTGMLSHVMNLVVPASYLIDDGTGEMSKNNHYFVLESCEYQRHLLAYGSEYVIIINIELDHVDYCEDMKNYCDTFEASASQIQKGIVLFGDDAVVRSLHVKTGHLYYDLESHNGMQTVHVKQHEDGIQFDVLYHKKLLAHSDLPFVGKPLLQSGLGVVTIGTIEGPSGKLLQEGLQNFPGAKRRSIIEENEDNVYIGGCAHHPTAMRYMIEAARIKHPEKEVITLFKPNRHSRIYCFMDRFAEGLNQADEACLCHFPKSAARKDGIDTTIPDLADRCERAIVINEDEEAARVLA